jgi:hypothetical protein
MLLLALSLAPAGAQPHLGGFLTLDKRLTVGGDTAVVADFYNRLRLELSAPLGEKLYLFSSAEARFYDLPRVRTAEDLEDPERAFPLDLMLWEGYADVYGFLLPNLDLRLGKQRVAWGRADRLNPTDNLNPDDFSDFTRFYEKLPTWAVKGTYYAGRFQVIGVWVPALTPVLLPRGGARLFLGGAAAVADGRLRLPDPEPGNGLAALKISSRLRGWDYSISYFTGYDDVPVLRRAVLGPGQGDVQLDLGFPRMQVLGADVVTDLRGIGLWGEAGTFWPEETRTRTVAGSAVQEEVTLDDVPYVRFTVGGDYTFPGGLYVNIQWMRGFFTERGRGNLHDYLIGEVERDVLRSDIKLSITGGWEVGAWDEVNDSQGYFLTPELTYQAIDNLELQVGLFFVEGAEESLFGQWEQIDQVYLRARVSF